MHADCYKIDWGDQRIYYIGRTNDPKLVGYISSDWYYTELHREDECGLYIPEAGEEWPVESPPL